MDLDCLTQSNSRHHLKTNMPRLSTNKQQQHNTTNTRRVMILFTLPHHLQAPRTTRADGNEHTKQRAICG
jgi:hypothetical protein